jgi:anti-sigma factor RsiW
MTDGTGLVGIGGHDGQDEHDFLSGYLDDELTVEERAEVEARLAASPELRAELDEIRVVRDAVRSLPRREAPAGFWDAVVANVETASATDDDAPTPDDDLAPLRDLGARRARPVPWRWIAGAAAAAAVVVAVIVVPGRTQVRPNVRAVATQHGAVSSDMGDSISPLATISPLVRRR